jgi:K+-transporting ATPase ATPase C chain
MLSQLRPAIVSTVAFTLLLGVAYPLAITGIAQVAMPAQANGALIRDAHGKVIGSALIGQAFAKPQYLHPRPSAAGKGYDASSSSGSNLGPLNPDLIARERAAAAALRASGQAQISADAVTASASGLDPDISPEYALAQAGRIAQARGVAAETVTKLISDHVQGPALGLLGQPRVNVLKVNLALDARLAKRKPEA